MTPEHRHPRRRDRSKDEDWIRGFLTAGETAVVAGVLDGLPFCLPKIFVYDRNREAIYVHGGYGGSTGRWMDQDDSGDGVPVALTVHEMGRLLPAEEALEFGVEYASVVLTGTAREVSDTEEAEHGLRLLMEKYAPHLKPGEDYRPIAPEEVSQTSVLRIDIESWSGKEKTAPSGFPGAYRLKYVL